MSVAACQYMDQTHSLSSTQRMADALLSKTATNLRTFIEERSARGLSYETIAKELYMATGGSVDVTYQTIKRWLIEFGVHS